jgi:hypothetical protein
MKYFKTYSNFINEAQSWNSVAKVMDKALKKAKVPISYAKDYVESLERMAKKTSKKFFDEYGDFTIADFIEDVEYNMANESIITEGKYNSTKNADDIFFLWDDAIDNDRSGIEHGNASGQGKKWSSFDFDSKVNGFSDFEKSVNALIKKNNWKSEWSGDHLSIFESYSDEQRMELADKGFALSDGSYPIKDLKDLKNAIMAYGRSKDQPRTAKFIVKRAKALGAEDLIPDTADFQKSIKESINESSEIAKLFQQSKHADIRMGEDKLYKLAMAWEDWNVDNDDKYDNLVDGLFAAVELIQNNNSADEKQAKGILKQFNKDIVKAMKLHTESLDEADAYKSATRNELAQYIINLQDEIKAYKQRGNKKYAEGSARDLEEVRAELASRK